MKVGGGWWYEILLRFTLRDATSINFGASRQISPSYSSIVNDQEGTWLKMLSLASTGGYLFSVEQKKDTQGLRLRRSVVGGRYMASEKQVRRSLSSSVLQERTHTHRDATLDGEAMKYA